MRDDHIISLIEETPMTRLSGAEVARREAQIAAHIADCAPCRQSYEAARLAQAMVQARAAETVEVSPFFKTRVMAALREKQLTPEAPALVRMWRAAGAMVSAMGFLVILLVGMTLFAGAEESPTATTEMPELLSIYTPEYEAFEPSEWSDENNDYDAVFETVYAAEDAGGNE